MGGCGNLHKQMLHGFTMWCLHHLAECYRLIFYKSGRARQRRLFVLWNERNQMEVRACHSLTEKPFYRHFFIDKFDRQILAISGIQTWILVGSVLFEVAVDTKSLLVH